MGAVQNPSVMFQLSLFQPDILVTQLNFAGVGIDELKGSVSSIVFKLLIDVDFVKQQLHVLNFENGAVFFIQVLGVCGAEFSFGIISLLKKYGVILDQVPDSFVGDVDFLPGLEPEAPCRGPKTVQTILEKCGQVCSGREVPALKHAQS